MSKWVLRGFRTGIVTTQYPDAVERNGGVSPGRPAIPRVLGSERDAFFASFRCPTKALARVEEDITIDYRRCVHCGRCVREAGSPVAWIEGYEWAGQMHPEREGPSLGGAFSRSLHIRCVDMGACGACMSEIEQIAKPHYNLHRLGFFFTPTPREADILLVVGPGTDHMRVPLEKAYRAMATPKKVVAVGTCALSGGLFGPSFACASGIEAMVPVDIGVPGCPPPPLAVLHALLVAVGRKPAVPLQTGRDSAPKGANP
jgi:Ni,Fe-hydrogenase III small subunit